MKNEIILLLFLIVSCSTDKKEQVISPKKPFEQGTKNTGKLVIKFNSKEKIQIKNFRMRFSKNFPTTKYEQRLQPSGFFPIPPIPVLKPRDSILFDDIEYETQEDIDSEKKLTYDIKPGSYFASFDSIQNENFTFEPSESKVMLFTFGYTYKSEHAFKEGNISLNGINSEYNEECKATYTGEYIEKTYNLNYCKKIEILPGKETVLTFNVSELKKNRFIIRFNMFFPGIFILAPFTNSLGYYNYRDYNVKLINP